MPIPTIRNTTRYVCGAGFAFSALVFCFGMTQDNATPPLAPLPDPVADLNPLQVELGRMLFFDNRLSGDDTMNCATCHDPDKGWGDGLPLAVGYPGSLYFRNTPTLLNVANTRYFFWDGRLIGSDMPTLVRDHIAEAHFFQADGRLVIERMRQTPVYEQMFTDAFGGEPTYGRILNAVTAYVKSIRSRNVPFDRHLTGNENAISDSAKRGLELFRGKAGCLRCHNGPMLSDSRFYKTGVPVNPDIFYEPLRHITFRRFFRTLGLKAAALREDPGLYAVTKQDDDWGRFRTPTLREVSRTGPYMHNGVFATLEEVIDFYNRGGGDDARKDPLLKPLGLTEPEEADLLEFLNTLSGEKITVERPERPPYELRRLGEE